MQIEIEQPAAKQAVEPKQAMTILINNDVKKAFLEICKNAGLRPNQYLEPILIKIINEVNKKKMA